MLQTSYYPNYYSIDDILVTEERVKCTVTSRLIKMGFLDASGEDSDLEVGKAVNLPLWYIKELKPNNSYFKVEVPELYKNVHKAVCEAEATHIELGKLHSSYYEYGKYLAPYDRTNIVGKIVFETVRQRIRYLLDISKLTAEDAKPESKLETIENFLYNVGMKTNILYTHWLQLKSVNIDTNDLVQEYTKKKEKKIFE